MSRKTVNLRTNLKFLLLLSILTGCVQQSTPTPVLLESSTSGLVVFSSYESINPHIEQIFLKNLATGEISQLTNEGSNSTPRWSPNGSQIVFTRASKENSIDIYIMEKDGSNQYHLVASLASERSPAWSPDGKQIAFVSDVTGKSDIYLIDLETQVTDRLTDSLEFADFPAWSSSGKKIAFQSSVGGGRSQIFIMNSDGTNLEQVTNYDVGNFDGMPFWCPDDSCIVFFRHEEGIDKLILTNLESKETVSLLENLSEPNLLIRGIGQSASRDCITFKLGEMFYALDMQTRVIYLLDVSATDLSLYP